MKGWVYIIQKVQPISSKSYSVSGESRNAGQTIEWECEVELHSVRIKTQNSVTENHLHTTDLNKCIENYFNKKGKLKNIFDKKKPVEVRAIYHELEDGSIFRTS